MQMRDSEIVASVVAGEPNGLAAAYDRYADPLYKYCRSLPGGSGDASSAVQDTFLIAAARLSELGNPERLRAWLYAVARNQCLRTRVSHAAAPAFADIPDTPDGAGEADTVIDITEGAAERTQLRALLAAAARGLDRDEREVLELQLRQDLQAAEIAAVLGVSRSHAYLLASRAREQLEACLVVLLVGRARRGECRELDGLLTEWDGELTPALRKRVHRHIERCATCGARRVYELRPAALLGLSPGAAMAAAAAESFRLAAVVPDELRAHTLELAAGQDPGSTAQRAAAAGRAGTFGHDGFPEPLRAGAKPALGSSRRAKAALAGAAVVAVGVTAAAFTLTGGGSSSLTLADGRTPAATVMASSAGPGTSPAGQVPSSSSSPAGTSRTPGAHTSTPSAAGTTTPGTQHPQRATARRPSPSATDPAAGTTSPAATQSAASVSLLGPGGAPLAPGSQLTIRGNGTSIVLRANGGTVNWSVTVSGGNDGHRVSVVGASSGTLAAGQTVSVQLMAFGQGDGMTLTVGPGGASYPLLIMSRDSGDN